LRVTSSPPPPAKAAGPAGAAAAGAAAPGAAAAARPWALAPGMIKSAHTLATDRRETAVQSDDEGFRLRLVVERCKVCSLRWLR
jgi:hypothetical protein